MKTLWKQLLSAAFGLCVAGVIVFVVKAMCTPAVASSPDAKTFWLLECVAIGTAFGTISLPEGKTVLGCLDEFVRLIRREERRRSDRGGETRMSVVLALVVVLALSWALFFGAQATLKLVH